MKRTMLRIKTEALEKEKKKSDNRRLKDIKTHLVACSVEISLDKFFNTEAFDLSEFLDSATTEVDAMIEAVNQVKVNPPVSQ